jgi:hypothetical protein
MPCGLKLKQWDKLYCEKTVLKYGWIKVNKQVKDKGLKLANHR